jgi:hypothetical protein
MDFLPRSREGKNNDFHGGLTNPPESKEFNPEKPLILNREL